FGSRRLPRTRRRRSSSSSTSSASSPPRSTSVPRSRTSTRHEALSLGELAQAPLDRLPRPGRRADRGLHVVPAASGQRTADQPPWALVLDRNRSRHLSAPAEGARGLVPLHHRPVLVFRRRSLHV